MPRRPAGRVIDPDGAHAAVRVNKVTSVTQTKPSRGCAESGWIRHGIGAAAINRSTLNAAP
jgi:hypothetical protein